MTWRNKDDTFWIDVVTVTRVITCCVIATWHRLVVLLGTYSSPETFGVTQACTVDIIVNRCWFFAKIELREMIWFLFFFSGERPYKCHLPECNRAFIQLSNLQQHLRNHESQVERAKNRPYVCNTCGKCFATDSSLRTHGSKVMSCSQNNVIYATFTF